MTQEFDPRKSYLTVKASEHMIAYVGFDIQFSDTGKSKEGVVKISSLRRPYGGGYLTLTFMVDKGLDTSLDSQLGKLFDNITEDSLRKQLGKGFERMIRVDLDVLEETKGWSIEEINVYFHTIAGREKVLVEEELLPALECTLPCKFESVEWWPEGRKSAAPSSEDFEEGHSLKGLFKKWFGSG
jgi:hypothetical protein